MRSISTAVACAALTTALLGTGCEKKTAPNVLVVESSGENSIVVHDPQLVKQLKMVDHKERKQGDLIDAVLVVQNQTDETVPFEYRVEWYDKDEIQIETPITSWKPVTVDGRMTKSLREVSPRAEAVAYKFMVRSPNSVDP